MENTNFPEWVKEWEKTLTPAALASLNRVRAEYKRRAAQDKHNRGN